MRFSTLAILVFLVRSINVVEAQPLEMTVRAERATTDVSAPSPSLYPPPRTLSGKNSHFTIIGDYDSREAALAAQRVVKAKQPDLRTAVFPHLPQTSSAWALVSAAYAPADEAEQHRAFALQTAIVSDAYVLRITADGWAKLESPVVAVRESILPASYPDLILPSGVAPAGSKRRFVSIGEGPTEEEVAEQAREMRAQFPGIRIAVFPPQFRALQLRSPKDALPTDVELADTNWHILLAANVSEDQASEAKRLANTLGLRSSRFDIVTDRANNWFPADRALIAEAKAVRERLDQCLRTPIDGKMIETIEDMRQCAAVLVTPRRMAACLGKDEIQIPQTLIEQGRYFAENCILLKDDLNGEATLISEKFNLSTKLDIKAEYLLNSPKLDDINNCKAQSGRSVEAFSSCVLPKLFSESQKQFGCLTEPTEAEKLACVGKIIKNDAIRQQVECISRLEPNATSIASCLASDAQKSKIANMQSCISASRSAADLASKCYSQIFDGGNLEKLTCMQRAGSNKLAMAKCVSGSADLNKALDTGACLANAKGDAVEIAKCAGGDAAEIAKVAACLRANAKDPLACVDNEQVKQGRRLYNCATSARDAASLIEGCGEGIGDPKARQAAACLVRANGDRQQMANCAAQAVLPGELGRLAGCAATSQGPTSFALCAAAPNMNEELRIAAECAVSSGGEPISFATCAGGRLTVRELTKCLNGQIGKDCFGENNTIVKYYRSLFEDYKKIFGGELPENNDLIKGFRAVNEAVLSATSSIREAYERSDLNLNRARENWNRSDFGKIVRF